MFLWQNSDHELVTAFSVLLSVSTHHLRLQTDFNFDFAASIDVSSVSLNTILLASCGFDLESYPTLARIGET